MNPESYAKLDRAIREYEWEKNAPKRHFYMLVVGWTAFALLEIVAIKNAAHIFRFFNEIGGV